METLHQRIDRESVNFIRVFCLTVAGSKEGIVVFFFFSKSESNYSGITVKDNKTRFLNCIKKKGKTMKKIMCFIFLIILLIPKNSLSNNRKRSELAERILCYNTDQQHFFRLSLRYLDQNNIYQKLESLV